jgi:sulfite oxidase
MKNSAAAKLFDKHPRLIVRETEPFNAEPPVDLLRASLVTPSEVFYVRNHAPVPQVDVDSFRLKINGMIDRAIEISLDELREKFTPQRVTATLQCAGNRRDGLMAIEIINGEVAWGAQAIGNASWTGVPLREVLEFAGADSRRARRPPRQPCSLARPLNQGDRHRRQRACRPLKLSVEQAAIRCL